MFFWLRPTIADLHRQRRVFGRLWSISRRLVRWVHRKRGFPLSAFFTTRRVRRKQALRICVYVVLESWWRRSDAWGRESTRLFVRCQMRLYPRSQVNFRSICDWLLSYCSCHPAKVAVQFRAYWIQFLQSDCRSRGFVVKNVREELALFRWLQNIPSLSNSEIRLDDMGKKRSEFM